MSLFKIAIITTHPIQYHAPLFSYLQRNTQCSLKVFYTLGEIDPTIYDKDFGINRSWNIDLLTGYTYELLKNVASQPSTTAFNGIRNPALIEKVEEFSPQAILVFGWKHHSHFKAMRYFKHKIPILFRGDSTTLDDTSRGWLNTFFRYKLLRQIYTYVDYVLSPGSASDAYFQKSGIALRHIIRAPHAVDNERFTSINETEKEELLLLKNTLGITSKDIVYLFAGKFISKKNPLLLIQAFALLAEKYANVRLLLVGNGHLEDQIKSLVDTYPSSIRQRISILPFQDQQQIKLIYRIGQVFVLPSKGPNETWGLSVNEALASGTPVIVSNKCGCSLDLIKQGVNGLIFESENFDDLCAKMEAIIDPEVQQRLTQNAHSSLEVHSFRSFAQALETCKTKLEN